MLSTETLQGIYDNNCEYLTALTKMELIDMCQNLARYELSLILNDSDIDEFDKHYNFIIKEQNGHIVEVCWLWNDSVKVTINPVNVTIDYNRRGNWSRESIFKTTFLHCFN